jgi:hypothetical protein
MNIKTLLAALTIPLLLGALPALAATDTAIPNSVASGAESSVVLTDTNGNWAAWLFNPVGGSMGAGMTALSGSASWGFGTSLTPGTYNILFSDNGVGYSNFSIYDSGYCGAGHTITDCGDNGLVAGYSIISFTVTAPVAPASGAIDIPTGLAPSLSSGVSGQTGDIGTLGLIALVAGLPLFFYVVKELLELLPQNRKGRK